MTTALPCRHVCRIVAILALLLSLAACALDSPHPETVESGNAGPVVNAETGSLLGGYTSKVSVAQGESLDFHLSANGGSKATLNIYREGPTRQLMTTLENLPVATYNCTGKYATGCGWPVATSFTVPKDWPSGAYIVTLTTAGNSQVREFIFWVREDNPGSTARLLFLSSVNTHQAYNDFGGGSLYGFGNTVKADKVSFNRPFSGGTGKYARWEAGAISWLESNGYKAEYATTYDLQFQPDLLSHYDVVMIVGHSEYWTWDARRQVEQFVNHGGRFLSLAGNVMWWQVRYEDDGRTMVGYKGWKDDPEKAPNLSTDNPGGFPILDNPLGLTGLYWPYGGYPGDAGDGYYAVHTNHWIFAGTGVDENQLIGNGPTKDSSIHDKESDGMPFNCGADGSSILGAPGSAGTPGNFTVLGLTNVYSKQRAGDAFAMMGLYTRPGGGALFAAGTTGWASGLGDPVIDRMTRNLLDRFLAGNVPAEPANPDADYFVYDRFNCYDVNRGRFVSSAWQDDISSYNFAAWTDNTSGRLTLGCGYSGSGLELNPGTGSSTRFTLAVRPNWATTNTLYSHFYLKLDGLGLGDGKVFNLAEQSNDNRQSEPAAAMVLQVRRGGNAYQMRYQPANADMAWVAVPGDRFFLVETGWNRNSGRVGLWIDGAGGDQPANLSSMPALNRFDLGVMQATGGVNGAYCLDELILDGKPFGDPPPELAMETLYISSSAGVKIGKLKAADEDILALNRETGAWSIYFDGSDVGLAAADVDAFQFLDDGSVLLSLEASSNVTGVGAADDSDVLRFVPATLGETTAGVFQMYVKGAAVGLATDGEDIDSIGLLPGGDLLIGTRGTAAAASFTWVGADLMRLSLQQTGANTQGTWSAYFDGSDVALSTAGENISAVWVDRSSGALYLATAGSFKVDGLSGLRGDVFVCAPITLGDQTTCVFPNEVYWSAKGAGLGTMPIDGFALRRAIP